jgi:hypothetical protein
MLTEGKVHKFSIHLKQSLHYVVKMHKFTIRNTQNIQMVVAMLCDGCYFCSFIGVRLYKTDTSSMEEVTKSSVQSS